MEAGLPREASAARGTGKQQPAAHLEQSERAPKDQHRQPGAATAPGHRGRDAVATAEQKSADLKKQIDANRELSTALSF